VFAVCFLQVPNMFPNFAMFSQHVFHTTSLLSHMPWKMVSSFHLYIGGQRGGTINFEIEPSVWGSLHSFSFLSDGPIKLARRQKKLKSRTWEAAHLNNRRDDYVPKFISLPLA
jgi:hypothetical protein